jgi:hypothetical protein
MGKGGGTKMVESSSRPDDVVKEFGYQNLDIASKLAAQQYQPYNAQRIQGFDPMEQASFDQIQGLTGPQGARSLGLGHGVASGLSRGLSGQALGQTPDAYNQQVQGGMAGYMNPYQDQMMGGIERDLNIGRERMARDASDQMDAANFGGSRAGVQDAMNNEAYLRQLGDASNRVRSDSYTQALGASQQAATNAPQNMAALAGLGLRGADQMRQSALSRLERDAGIASSQQAAGGLQREMQQAGLNQRYADWTSEADYGTRMLQLRSQQLGLTPAGSINKIPVQQDPTDFGGLMKGAGALITAVGCWVAREVYGADPSWIFFRDWLHEDAPDWLVALYTKHGEKFAEWISDKPAVKWVIRQAMDVVVGRRARAYSQWETDRATRVRQSNQMSEA